MRTILGLDIGTTTLCTVVLDAQENRLVAARSLPNDALIPGLPAGRHEQDADRIMSRACDLLKTTLALGAVRREDVSAIALTGQMHGVLLVDAGVRPLTPLITWRDQRTVERAGPGSLSAARNRLPPDYATRAGCELHVGYGGATLRWLAAEGMLPRQSTAVGIGDFVAARLTGVVVSEPTLAASWGLLDICRLAWDEQSVTELEIPGELLPKLRPSGQVCGTLVPELAAALGLHAGIAVHAHVGDNQASVIGAGGGREYVAVLNLGTGGQISVPRQNADYLSGFETRPMPHGDYILVGASLSAGAAYASLCRFFGACVNALTESELSEGEIYAQLNRLAATAPPGAEGLSVDPRFLGTRPDPMRRGEVTGIDAANLTPANLARAFCEGMIEELAEAGARIGMAGIREIAAGGNAVRNNPLLPEIIASRFGIPCTLSPFAEEAAVGAARYAAQEAPS